MEAQPQWVGIDVSKASLEVDLRASQPPFQCPNHAQGIAKLIERLQGSEIQQVVLESTGRLELECASALQAHGFAVSIINPRQRRDFTRASGKLAKPIADARSPHLLPLTVVNRTQYKSGSICLNVK